MIQGDRVRQRERWRIDNAVDQTEDQECTETFNGRELKDKYSAKNMADSKIFFSVKVTIGKLASHKWRNDGSDCTHAECVSNFDRGELAHIEQIRPQDGQPCSPNCVLQKHHHRKTGSNPSDHGRCRKNFI